MSQDNDDSIGEPVIDERSDISELIKLEPPLSSRKTRSGRVLGERDSLEETLKPTEADNQSSQDSDTLSGVWGVPASQLMLDSLDPKSQPEKDSQESQADSQLSRYELMERAAEGCLSQQIMDPEDSQASKSSSHDSSLYKTPQNSQKSTQYRTPEGTTPQTSPGPTQYMTPENSSPKTPSISSQEAPATPPLPGKKTKRSLFTDNNAENTESPDIIVASRVEDMNQAVTTKDSSTQDSGETLTQRSKLGSQDMEVQTSASLADNTSSQILTQESIDLEQLLSHTQLVFDTQGSEDSDYATPPSSPERNAEISSAQKTFDETLDDDYFQKLRSPRSDKDESTDLRSKHTRADVIVVIEENDSFLAAVSSARAANMQMFIERSKTCTKIEDHLRYQVIKNLFSTDNEELRQMATWKPVIPELEDDEPEEREAPSKVSRTELPPPSPKKRKQKSSPASAEISSQSQSQQMSQAVENWSQEVHSGNIQESQSSRARPFIPEDAILGPILQDDQPAQDPSQKSATNLRQRVSEFLFPSSRSPPKNKRKRSKSPDKSEKNTSKRAAVKTTVLKPSADITVPRRPGRDALSDITDLSSAFDNDSPIRVREAKAKQSKRLPASLTRNEKSLEPKRTSLKNKSDQPTCSKYFLPGGQSTQMRDISAMLSESESENDSSDEERAPVSLPRERQRDAAKLPKMTKLKSPTKSRLISKHRMESSSRNKAGKQDTVVRKPLRSINSSLDTRDPREVLEEVAITIKDVKNFPGKIGLTFDTEKPSHIYVKEVVPGSPADMSGFKPDDIIVSFNRTRCSYKSRVTLSVFLCMFTESEEADFDFVVVRDLPDTFSAGEASDADTSEVSDISDMKQMSNVISEDSGNDLKILFKLLI
ncbi:unnamed protein product [Oikopleura dioica]|uniref:PDZ domain-containing protein n=1 Tax=Oikopleura dioica TaxID=34765 RepID=E4WYK6_OIKDI|nr:unnamed protein product [Oikopleura dioica]